MISRKQLEDLSKWAGLVGILTIIMGALQAISLVGIIPGVIMIILGVKLRNAKKSADQLLAMGEEGNKESQVYQIFDNIISYFKIQGILFIISIVLIVLGFIFVLGFGMVLPGLTGY